MCRSMIPAATLRPIRRREFLRGSWRRSRLATSNRCRCSRCSNTACDFAATTIRALRRSSISNARSCAAAAARGKRPALRTPCRRCATKEETCIATIRARVRATPTSIRLRRCRNVASCLRRSKASSRNRCRCGILLFTISRLSRNCPRIAPASGGLHLVDGEALASTFDQMTESTRRTRSRFALSDYPELFDAVAGSRMVRRRAPNAGVRIYGPLEARLQQADRRARWPGGRYHGRRRRRAIRGSAVRCGVSSASICRNGGSASGRA